MRTNTFVLMKLLILYRWEPMALVSFMVGLPLNMLNTESTGVIRITYINSQLLTNMLLTATRINGSNYGHNENETISVDLRTASYNGLYCSQSILFTQ